MSLEFIYNLKKKKKIMQNRGTGLNIGQQKGI